MLKHSPTLNGIAPHPSHFLPPTPSNLPPCWHSITWDTLHIASRKLENRTRPGPAGPRVRRGDQCGMWDAGWCKGWRWIWNRDRVPFVLTTDMVDTMNGGVEPLGEQFQEFVELSCRAFNVLRHQKDFLLSYLRIVSLSLSHTPLISFTSSYRIPYLARGHSFSSAQTLGLFFKGFYWAPQNDALEQNQKLAKNKPSIDLLRSTVDENSENIRKSQSHIGDFLNEWESGASN